MSDDTVVREVSGTDPEAGQIMNLVNVWREAFAAFEALAGRGSTEAIDPASLTHAVTAAAVMAGTFFGNAIIGGLATDQDRRRAGEMVARNFRTGIDIGKRQGLRAAADLPVAGHA